MRKLNIAVLTEIINFHSGSRAPLEIARHLSRLRNNVTVYAFNSMHDSKAKKSLEKDKVKIILIKKNKVPYFGKYLSAITLYKILKKERPDIMTFSGTPAFFFAAKLTKIPLIRIYMGTQFNAFLERKIPGANIAISEKLINFIANIYIYIIDFISFRLASGIVAISQYSKRIGQKLYKKNASAVIYLGTTILSKNVPVTKKDKNIIELISVSRITPYKGFHLIIEALKKVQTKKRLVLNIVGSQQKPKYLKYLKKIGGNLVKVHLNLNDSELAKLYRKSDIYVSADKYLFFGLPICEAAIFKLPTISYNLAAANEIIQNHKTGYIARNQEEFTKYVTKIIENSPLRREMGQNAYVNVKNNFTWENTAKEYNDFFLKFLKIK